MSTISKTEAHAGDGDQKNTKVNDPKQETNNTSADRLNEGKDNAHDLNDPNDSRSLANRAAAEKKKEKEEKEAEENKPRPTDAARANGNEPSRGAKIDEQIEREEQEELERKGKA